MADIASKSKGTSKSQDVTLPCILVDCRLLLQHQHQLVLSGWFHCQVVNRQTKRCLQKPATEEAICSCNCNSMVGATVLGKQV